MAFLNRGLEIRFRDERPAHLAEETYRYTGGIVDYVKHLNTSKESLFRKVAAFSQAETDQEVEVALQWNTGYYESIYSFANGIATNEGGMHEEGFKKGLTNVVNKYARAAQRRQGVRREPDGRGHPRGPHRNRVSPAARIPSSKVRPKPSWATCPYGRWSRRRRTTSSLNGWRRTRKRRARSCRRRCSPSVPASPHARPATSPGARPLWTAPASRASSSTARHASPASPSCSSSKDSRLLGIGPGRAQSSHPGDPADQGQDPECREGPGRQDAEERRDPGPHLGDRRRCRR